MNSLNEVIKKFETTSLEEMESVKLMDRVDTKYVFSISHLPRILEGMASEYSLLEIGNVRMHRYESLYYDTPDFSLYHKHQSGRLNRHKIRFRRYVDSSGLTFFEIKFKNNKARTIKERIKIQSMDEGIAGKAKDFLKEMTPYSPAMLDEKIWVNYSRMTFVNKHSQERLTIDTNLHFIKPRSSDNFTLRFPQMVIAEAKRDKASSVSRFIRLVRQTGVRESGISKYCFGIYNMYQDVKKNNFKERIRFIYKMSATGS